MENNVDVKLAGLELVKWSGLLEMAGFGRSQFYFTPVLWASLSVCATFKLELNDFSRSCSDIVCLQMVGKSPNSTPLFSGLGVAKLEVDNLERIYFRETFWNGWGVGAFLWPLSAPVETPPAPPWWVERVKWARAVWPSCSHAYWLGCSV